METSTIVAHTLEAPGDADAPAADARGALSSNPRNIVTARCFLLGLLLAAGLGWLNCWMYSVSNVYFLGCVQMSFGAIFAILVLVLVVNGPLRLLQRGVPKVSRIFPPLSTTELITIYAMLLFASLISTPGGDNFFLTVGPGLFYYSTRENRWADLFYRYLPRSFAPGWDGHTFDQRVIQPLFLGGLSFSQIPWHAWVMVLITWTVLLLLLYATLFFFSLLMRRQWIDNEALTFPLVQVPLQMVEAGRRDGPNARRFWRDASMWCGFLVALFILLLRGLNNYFPDWPRIAAFQGNTVDIAFTEQPWNAMGSIGIEFFLGAIGIGYLLTREMSLSFWVFFLLFKLELVISETLGFPPGTLPKDTYLSRPTFVVWQSFGGWVMMAITLLWTARGHIKLFARAAWSGRGHAPGELFGGEPLSPRFVLGGLFVSVAGVFGWCWFAGVNLLAAVFFFGLYGLTCLVLARLVVEGGTLWPQIPFAPVEMMAGSVMGVSSMGVGTLTRFTFVQPMIFSAMRTNLLPAFLNTLKMAHEVKLDRRNTRRLLGAVIVTVVMTLAVTVVASLQLLYSVGGLACCGWFTHTSYFWQGTATMLHQSPQPSVYNWTWAAVGVAIVWLLMFARTRFLWFPLHPLAYIVATGFPITLFWPSLFIAWLVKSLLLRFGGQDAVNRARPFMIGLILGNATGMVASMVAGVFLGSQIQFWPA